MSNYSVLYYTDNNLPKPLEDFFQLKLLESIDSKSDLVSVSHRPIIFGRNFHVGELHRSEWNMWRQIHLGLENCHEKYTYLCEHDVLYAPDHFKAHENRILRRWRMDGIFNVNLKRMNELGYIVNHFPILSQLCVKTKRFKRIIGRCIKKGIMPKLEDHGNYASFYSINSSIDVRHGS